MNKFLKITLLAALAMVLLGSVSQEKRRAAGIRLTKCIIIMN